MALFETKGAILPFVVAIIMKLLGLIFTAITAFAVAVPVNATDSCQVVAQDCSFYERCAEKHFNCGAKGYALGYGQKYCQAFKKDAPNFTPQGQRWIDSVMFCLQGEIVPLVENGTSMTCPEFKNFAYDTHPRCYTLRENSVCKLPLPDWLRLLFVVRDELLDPAMFKQALQVAKDCKKQIPGMVTA